MKQSTLNRWADLLFDTGKRNNLVNFRNAKMGTAEIVAPDIGTLFARAEHSAVFEVFVPDQNDLEELTQSNATPDDEALPPEEAAAAQRVTREQYYAAYAHKLKKGQVLVYNSAAKPLQALKNISKRGRTAIEETGVNILYLAFGFINWCEDTEAHYMMKAPILLVPVTIENETALDPYCIKVTDDDIIVNPTFSYKLQNEFGFTLPPFDEDEDINAYFDRIEELVSRLKWTVSRECKLGIFSFLKINMYQDLRDNADIIIRNHNVRAMAGDDPATLDLGGNVQTPTEPLELHNVVDADSSQSDAIEMAKLGRSFVLQGPPGTGKSQTITNIIAECLADGKSVLFVSEKLAALNVVYDKLKKAGLTEFCLELHSHKANKRQVIDELCHTLRLQRSTVSDRAQYELDTKRRAQRQLDSYEKELHRRRPVINQTLYELYEEVAACREAPDTDFVINDIKQKGEEYIERAAGVLEKYVGYFPSIGCDYRRNAWFGFETADTSYQAVMQLRSDLEAFIGLCAALCRIAEEVDRSFGITIDTLQEIALYRDLFALVSESTFITPALLANGKRKQLAATIGKLQPIAAEILADRALLDGLYDADLYKLDGALYHKKLTRQFGGFFSRLFNREYREIRAALRLCRRDGKKPSYENAVAHMAALARYQENEARLASKAATVAPLFGKGYLGAATDFEKLAGEVRALEAFEKQGVSYERLAKITPEELAAEQATLSRLVGKIDKALDESPEARERVLSHFDSTACELTAMGLSALADKLRACLQTTDQLDNWCEFTKLLGELQELEIKAFTDAAIDRKITAELLLPTFKKAFYMQWVDAVLHDSPLLLSLARVPHDEAVKRFKEKDELNFEINKAKIRTLVSARRPGLDMVAQGSAISILLREGEKRRKQKGVRQLLQEIGELAQTLKPCFLMSPLSVSTFLCADMQFDTVVFDEASQIFPQDAIGAIYRGKQLIVVGDSKQMPPSNFFNASVEADDEEAAESITDYESILDLCATSLPQRRLKWHYRSRFEQLIAFSNKHFYDNDLVTFPSAKADAPEIGVDYHYVDGVFDRVTKTNRVEAERVVELVFENLEKYPERSLGVVAFSISQQDLIEKLISRRRRSDPSMEAFFKSDRAEPFFVKNLETVQGDERDTIIFSVAYAKDAKDKLLLNFGPINREGGERRLNVAVTRAKCNVQLVTSMHHSDIDLSRTGSVGARLLREYLNYAENGAAAPEPADSTNAFEAAKSELVMEIRDFLREKGYEADTHVGRSALKIDVALKHPDSGNYLMAIECDGETYHASKTARDRDRLREAVLENMGWSFYRIWSVDWFRSKRVEKERLLAAVEAVMKNAPPTEEKQKTPQISFEEQAAQVHFSFPKYKLVNPYLIQSKHDYSVPHVIREILETESPVAEEWMLKRVMHLYGRDKVTPAVTRAYEADMYSCRSLGIIRRNGFLYLKDQPVPMLRVPGEDASVVREIKHIAIEELALGLKALLRENVSAEKSGLFRLLVQYLGFSRAGDAMLARLESALQLILEDIDIDGDVLSIK